MPACFSKYKFTEKLTNFCEDDPAWLLSVAVAATGLSQTWSHVAAAAGESYTCGGTVCPFGGLLLIYVHLFSFLHLVGLTCDSFLYEKNGGPPSVWMHLFNDTRQDFSKLIFWISGRITFFPRSRNSKCFSEAMNVISIKLQKVLCRLKSNSVILRKYGSQEKLE